ncbi:MAG: L,D-transpeptidase family protein [Alphaproteobacteria bacterium]
MDIVVNAQPAAGAHHGILAWNSHQVPCALGRAGISPDKSEGDGATPAGSFPLRQVLFRSDRISPPRTGLPLAAIEPDDGWCDAPDHNLYNRLIRLPFDASCEHLWRQDHRYDVIVVVGYNDDPPTPAKGSAIFIHLAGPEFPATEGCVALAAADMLRLLTDCGPKDRIRITTA